MFIFSPFPGTIKTMEGTIQVHRFGKGWDSISWGTCRCVSFESYRQLLQSYQLAHSPVTFLTFSYERRRGGEGSDSVDLLKLLLNREDDKSKPMTKQEVIENCFAFLLAGYETTSTAMTYCSYLLSKYPNVQQKLYEEIMEAKENGGLTYDSIHNMKYLDYVYKETLRCYPPVIQ